MGSTGELLIGGYPLEILAAEARFPEVVYLLWNGAPPPGPALESFERALAAHRDLSPETITILKTVAPRGIPVMDALRLGLELAEFSERARRKWCRKRFNERHTDLSRGADHRCRILALKPGIIADLGRSGPGTCCQLSIYASGRGSEPGPGAGDGGVFSDGD